MKVGLYFGSFNPVHIGHLIIGQYIADQALVDQVWFVISPQNPLKSSKTLLNEYHRLHLLQLALNDNPNLKASDLEFKLPRPSYTIDTLTYLQEKYAQHTFFIIMGSDSYSNIHNWKNGKLLLEGFPIIVYTRPKFEISQKREGVTFLNAPLLDISSTLIRENIATHKSIRYLVTEDVRKEIETNNYYKKGNKEPILNL